MRFVPHEPVSMDTVALTDCTPNWTEIFFEFSSQRSLSTAQRQANMYTIKNMLTGMELRNGSDYVFVKNTENTEPGITVKFKDSGNALIAAFKWMARDKT
jgi:hypothetical protein